MSRPQTDIFERIADGLEIDQVTNCWVWTKAKTNAGYGVFGNGYKTVTLHRFMYGHFVGAIPPNHDVHHLCENKACGNPIHLALRTRKTHMAEHASKRETCEKCGGQLALDARGHRRCNPCLRERENAYRRNQRAQNPKPNANAAKTKCKHGHEFTKDNTRINPNGSRSCIECAKRASVEYWRRTSNAPARGTQKEKCVHGHAMTEANTYIYRGRRSCRECISDRIHKSRAKKRQNYLIVLGPVGGIETTQQGQ